MNKNIQIIIKRINKKSLVININPFKSIYSIKDIVSKNLNIPISDITLEYKSYKLKNNYSILHYNLVDKSIIFLKEGKIKGGVEYTTIIYYIYIFLSLIAILVFTIFMISGFNVFFSQVYKIVVIKCFHAIFKLFNSSDKQLEPGDIYASKLNSSALGKLSDVVSGGITSVVGTILHYFGLILEYGSLYFFNYIGSALCFFPIIYLLNNNLCSSTYIADRVGFSVSLVFIIIYGLYRGPKMIIGGFNSLLNRNPLLAFLSPLMIATKKLTSHITFDPIYAIPIIGQLILGYHSMIAIFIDTINYGASIVRGVGVTCDGLENLDNKNKINQMIDKILPLFCYLLMLDEAVKKQNNRHYDISKVHVPDNIPKSDNSVEIFQMTLDDQQNLLDNAKKYIDPLVYFEANSVAPIVRDWNAERYITLFKYSFLALIGLPIQEKIEEIEEKYKKDEKDEKDEKSNERFNEYTDLHNNIDVNDIFNLDSGSTLMYLPTVDENDGILNYSETLPLPITEIKIGDRATKKDILKSLLKLWISMMQRYNRSGYIARFSDPELLDIMFSNIGYKTVCSLLETIQSIADLIIDSGNPFDLTDMICSANIAGIGSSIIIVILFIQILVYHFFSWKLFGKNI